MSELCWRRKDRFPFPDSRNKLIGAIIIGGNRTKTSPINSSDSIDVLVEIEGKTLLERGIKTLQQIGIKNIIILAGIQKEKIENFIQICNLDCNIYTFPPSKKELRSGHVLRSASHLFNKLGRDVVVFFPNCIYEDTEDLHKAKEIFYKYNPAILQTVTVVPSCQRSNLIYFSNSLRNISSNLFDNRRSSHSNKGLLMFFAGLTFFSRKALNYFPGFKDLNEEHEYLRFLTPILKKQYSIFYLLEGKRYNFKTSEDREIYKEQINLPKTNEEGVSIILLNKNREVLLQLRDTTPTIRYPGYWGLFGGTINLEESARDAMKREIKEELGVDMTNFSLFRNFIQNKKKEYAFIGLISTHLSKLRLREGKDMRFFKFEEIEKLKIRPDDRETLMSYIRMLSL